MPRPGMPPTAFRTLDRLGHLASQNEVAADGAAFFERIPDPGRRFMGTHPANADRIAVVQAVVEGRHVPSPQAR